MFIVSPFFRQSNSSTIHDSNTHIKTTITATATTSNNAQQNSLVTASPITMASNETQITNGIVVPDEVPHSNHIIYCNLIKQYRELLTLGTYIDHILTEALVIMNSALRSANFMRNGPRVSHITPGPLAGILWDLDTVVENNISFYSTIGFDSDGTGDSTRISIKEPIALLRSWHQDWAKVGVSDPDSLDDCTRGLADKFRAEAGEVLGRIEMARKEHDDLKEKFEECLHFLET